MTLYLKQSTARNIGIGQLLSTTDGLTAFTTAVELTDIHLWKGTGTTVSHAEAATVHISNGIHYLALGTTDTDTVGSMVIFMQPTGCLPYRLEVCVLAANVYDSLIGGGAVDLLDVSTVQWTGTAVHAPGTAGIPIVELHDPSGITIGTVTTVTGGATSAELAKVPKSDSTVTWNATALASIQTECNDALVANNLDHLLLTPVAEDMTSQCADGSIFGRFLTGGDTSAFISTDSIIDIHAAIVGLVADVGDAGMGNSLVSELAKVPKSDSTVTFNATALASIADSVWDEVLTGATHNVASSAGRRLRSLDANYIHSGTCQAGSAANTIVLDTGASATDGWYDPAIVVIDGGTGIGQCRRILDYVGTSRTAIVNQDWRTTPDNTSTFVIYLDGGQIPDNEGQAQAGGASTITLNTHAVATNDLYVGATISLVSGTGKGQTRIITGYVGDTKVATVHLAWTTQPAAGTGYYIIPNGWSKEISPITAATISDAVWDEVLHTDHEVASSASVLLQAATAPSAADVADAVWDEAIASHVSAGTTGKAVTDALADTNELQTDWANGGRLDLILDAASAPTAAAVADAVWDEALAGHAGAGTAGNALSTASSGGVDVTLLADAVWDEATSGHVTAGTTGKALVDALADTNELQVDWVNGGRLDLLLDAAVATTATTSTISPSSSAVILYKADIGARIVIATNNTALSATDTLTLKVIKPSGATSSWAITSPMVELSTGVITYTTSLATELDEVGDYQIQVKRVTTTGKSTHSNVGNFEVLETVF